MLIKQAAVIVSAPGLEEAQFASPDLQQRFGNEQAVIDIGRAYRAAHRHENSIRALGARLVDSVGEGSRPSMTALKRKVIADFEQGRVVKVNGWILSLTEARQCALYSLLHA